MEPNNKPLILIVDDTPQNIQVLGNILYEKGYNISLSPSGSHALQSVKSQAPDLILLDILMPEMNGYEVCKELKSNPATKDIPVIFLTAITETESILHGFEFGAADYITKPFNVAELTARIATHIELKKSKEKIGVEKDKVDALNKKLKAAYDHIKDSINYAKLIQEGMLPDLNILQTKGIRHLVIYKPKETISGDFYWAEYCNERVFIAVADCTGHGVPGALLSMSGHNLLNEIVNIEKIYDPAKILNTLNERVCGIFKQELSEIHDGMDIALCVIDNNAKTLEYAGANIPLWYLNKDSFNTIAPDSLSIGDNNNEKNIPCFNKHSIDLNIGDRFFMSTDGIPDQFDNTNQNKITSERFVQKLSLYTERPFDSIKKDLLEFLKEWQGCNHQTDDILLLGIEIS